MEVAAESFAGLCRASERGGDAYRLIEKEHGESSHRLGAAEVMCYATLHLGILEKRNDLLLRDVPCRDVERYIEWHSVVTKRLGQVSEAVSIVADGDSQALQPPL